MGGVHEAKIYRLPHMAQLKVELAPVGLKVTSSDPMIIEDHPDPGSVPNVDTIPMVLRKESFQDRKPESHGCGRRGASFYGLSTSSKVGKHVVKDLGFGPDPVLFGK